MATEKLSINEIVDPLAARVIVEEGAGDPQRLARFDITGVPRVDKFLVGRPAAGVPTMVTRLCGLCPVTHHLAGIAALDGLLGAFPGAADQRVRLLMHHGSVVDVMGSRLGLALGGQEGRDAAVAFKQLGKQILALAGVPGHFPDVAVPGGVRRSALPDAGAADQLRGKVEQGIAEARGVLGRLEELARERAVAEETTVAGFEGANVFVADADGSWNPLGRYFAVEYRGEREVFSVTEFDEQIRETMVGSNTPCPEVLFAGSEDGDAQWLGYRVGPAARFPGEPVAVAQVLSVGQSLDAVAELLAGGVLTQGEDATTATVDEQVTGRGIGVVDGPRGVLVHEYEVEAGQLMGCEILSPTAQNEPWLAQMLSKAYREGGDMEAAVRAADPCLPCTQAPVGAMNIQVVKQ